MKKSVLAIALPAILGLSVLVSGSASAMTMGMGGGAHAMLWAQNPDQAAAQLQTRFESAAKMLGISVEDVKAAWAEGTSMQQLAKDKGVTADQLRARALEQHRVEAKTQLQSLVTKGIITQAQADARLKFMETQWKKMDTTFQGQKDKKGKKVKSEESRKEGARGGFGMFGGMHF